MNKIYKVVWSKVKNCYVVVSEIAKNIITGGVKSAKVGAAPMAKGLALGAAMAFVITGNVWAGTLTENNTVNGVYTIGGIGNQDGLPAGATTDGRWDLGDKKLVINKEAQYGYAVWANNYSFTGADGSVLEIKATEGNKLTYGLGVNGSVNVDSLTIESVSNAIYAAATTNITANNIDISADYKAIHNEPWDGKLNLTANETLRLTGDISNYNNTTNIDATNATQAMIKGDVYSEGGNDRGSNVTIKFGANGSLTGKIVTDSASATTLDLGNGSTWNMTGDSTVTKLTGAGYKVTGDDVLNLKSTLGRSGDVEVGELNIEAQGNGIGVYGDMTVTANEIDIKAGNSAIYTEYPSGKYDTKSNLTINVAESLTVNSTGHGINSGTNSAGNTIVINGEGADVTINAAENAVDSRGINTNIEIDAANVTIKSTNTGEQDANWKGYAVISRGQGSSVEINATGKVDIDSTKNAVYANKGTISVIADTVDIDTTSGAGVRAGTSANDTVRGNGHVVLGDANTSSITIDGQLDYGIIARAADNNANAEKQSSVVVNGESLVIGGEEGSEVWAGVVAASGTDGAYSDPSTTVTLNSQYTEINATKGIYNMSNGVVVANGDLTVNAKESAIVTRGLAETIINKSGENTVKIDGDIEFSKDYDYPESQVKTDAKVDLTLSDADSYLKGNIIVTNSDNVTTNKATYEDISGMSMSISNGATWETDAASFVNNLYVDGGNVSVKNAQKGSVTVGNLAAVEDLTTLASMDEEDKVLNIKVDKVVAGTVSVGTKGDDVKVVLGVEDAGDLGVNVRDGVKALYDVAVLADGTKATVVDEINVDKFDLKASLTAANGKVTTTIQPGDNFVIDSKNVEVNGVVKAEDVKAGDVSLKATAADVEALEAKTAGISRTQYNGTTTGETKVTDDFVVDTAAGKGKVTIGFIGENEMLFTQNDAGQFTFGVNAQTGAMQANGGAEFGYIETDENGKKVYNVEMNKDGVAIKSGMSAAGGAFEVKEDGNVIATNGMTVTTSGNGSLAVVKNTNKDAAGEEIEETMLISKGADGKWSGLAINANTGAAQFTTLNVGNGAFTANATGVAVNGGMTVNGNAVVTGGLNVGTDVVASNGVSLQGTADQVALQGNKITALENASAEQSGKITALEGLTSEQGNKIGALESLTSEQGNKIGALEGLTAEHSDKIGALEDDSKEQAGKITALEGLTSEQGNKITALEGLTSEQGNKITALENAAGEQSGKITALEGLTAEHSDKIGALEGLTAEHSDKIGALEGLTAEHSDKIGALEDDSKEQAGKITALENSDAEQNKAINGLNQRLGKLNGKVNKVGAGAAALAALHPLEYDPDDKLTFSAGVGNYAGETAAALGAFYRPDEKLMFSLGGTMGNGENMVNLGVSIGLDGAKGAPKLSRKELVEKVSTMEAENQAIKAENENIKAEVAELKALVAKLVSKK